ncbi:SDR family NAD(P)-dependent oxidoreductase [Paenibacillus sp. SI8]|uniref:SDR family NAD(P)-dependent oxidoreductase n=1 Tax=unclassified Paenibacillus TaxID=185978 RepID=UPI00346643B1
MPVIDKAERKIAVVTASYSGLGTELCKLLAADGFNLVLINRDSARTLVQIQELNAIAPWITISSITADLSNQAAIQDAAKKLSEQYSRVDLLVNNAGVVLDRLQISPQGNDVHYEVNTVAPYLLTKLLRPQLVAAKRAIVIVVGSSAMKMARKLELGRLRNPGKFKKFAPYAQSKLATATVFFAMAASFAKEGILLRIVDPGPNQTAMSTNQGVPGWFKMFRRFFALPKIGARRIYDAAMDHKFGEQSGIYIERGKVTRPPVPVLKKEMQEGILALLHETTAI